MGKFWDKKNPHLYDASLGPDDYAPINQQLITFSPGSESRSVLLRTVEDMDVESQEQLTATLSVDRSLFPGVSIEPESATIDIIDDDS